MHFCTTIKAEWVKKKSIFFCFFLHISEAYGGATEASWAKDLASRSLKRAAPLISPVAARLEVPNVQPQNVKVMDACGAAGSWVNVRRWDCGKSNDNNNKILKEKPCSCSDSPGMRWWMMARCTALSFLSPSYKPTFKSEGMREGEVKVSRQER